MKRGLNNKAGLTLIEALIWFAVFAAVVAGVFALYSNNRDANTIAKTNKELATIFVKGSALYEEGNTGFATDEASSGKIINDMAIQLGIIPDTLKANGTVISNSYGGTVNFVSRTSGFVVQYSNIPTGKACMNIVKGQSKVGWGFVVVGGLSRVYYDNNYNTNLASELCKGDGGKAAGSIGLQFASCTNC